MDNTVVIAFLLTLFAGNNKIYVIHFLFAITMPVVYPPILI